MSRCKILIVDDSCTVRVKIERALRLAGYEVIEASDGHEALAKARDHLPALAILDINMPGLDGYQVIDQLKQMGPPLDQIPIVFLTSVRSRALEVLGDHFGAYLHKPVAEHELISVVRRELARIGLAASLDG